MTNLLYMRPDWPVSHTWELKTDVLKARDGTEHRIALMSSPREVYDLTYTLYDEDVRYLKSRLLLTPEGPWYLPCWEEETLQTTKVSASDTTVNVVDTYLDWLEDGQKILVIGPDATYDLATISGDPAAGVINLVDPLVNGYGANASHVVPVMEVLISDRAAWGKHPMGVTMWRIKAARKSFSTTFGTGAASLTTFDSLYVMDYPLNADDLFQEQSVANLETFDEGFSMSQLFVATRSDLNRAVVIRFSRAAQRQWVKKFVTTVRSCQIAFLCPTWAPDLIHNTGTLAGGATTVVVTNQGDYVANYWPTLTYRRIQIRYTSGVIDRRVVTNATGTTTQTLTVAALTGGTVSMISFLELCRLSSDETVRTYESSAVGHCTIPLMVVQQ